MVDVTYVFSSYREAEILICWTGLVEITLIKFYMHQDFLCVNDCNK